MMYKKIYFFLILLIFSVLMWLVVKFSKNWGSHKIQKYFMSQTNYDDAWNVGCMHNTFKWTLLVLNFNFPLYDNIDVLKHMYDGAFGRIVTCGPPPFNPSHSIQPDIIFDERYGHLGYYCMALAMKKYPNFKGYMFANDDMVVNWWTMAKLNRSKIWHGTKVVDWRQLAFEDVINSEWIWWKSRMGIEACQGYYSQLKLLARSEQKNFNASRCLQIFLRNGQGNPRCSKGWADFFYVPHYLSKDFMRLSEIAYHKRLFLEIAVHNILRSLDYIENFEVVDGLYLPDTGKLDYKSGDFWSAYNRNLAFLHPFKLQTKDRHMSLALLKEKVIKFTDVLTSC